MQKKKRVKLKIITLSDAKKSYKIETLEAQPVDNYNDAWLTYNPENRNIILQITAGGTYKATRGASTDFYGVYWVDILSKLPDGNLNVINLPKLGKRKDIEELTNVVEPRFVYPGIRGRDIKKWCARPEYYVFIVQDPKTRTGYEESHLQINFPKTYDYFLLFKEILLQKKSFWKYFSKKEELKKKTFEKDLEGKYKYIKFERKKISKENVVTFIYFCSNDAFYTMFNIGEKILAPFLVVWRRMGNRMIAAVISTISNEFFSKKKLIPTDTTAYVHFKREEEAHFFCAFLNSDLIDQSIKAFSGAGRGFAAPSVIQKLYIPQYEVKNEVFTKLADLSKKAHSFAEISGNEKNLKDVEKQINDLVSDYYSSL